MGFKTATTQNFAPRPDARPLSAGGRTAGQARQLVEDTPPPSLFPRRLFLKIYTRQLRDKSKQELKHGEARALKEQKKALNCFKDELNVKNCRRRGCKQELKCGRGSFREKGHRTAGQLVLRKPREDPAGVSGLRGTGRRIEKFVVDVPVSPASRSRSARRAALQCVRGNVRSGRV